jgi:hypothetical protein
VSVSSNGCSSFEFQSGSVYAHSDFRHVIQTIFYFLLFLNAIRRDLSLMILSFYSTFSTNLRTSRTRRKSGLHIFPLGLTVYPRSSHRLCGEIHPGKIFAVNSSFLLASVLAMGASGPPSLAVRIDSQILWRSHCRILHLKPVTQSVRKSFSIALLLHELSSLQYSLAPLPARHYSRMCLGSWKHPLFDSQPATIIRCLSLEQVTPPTPVALQPSIHVGSTRLMPKLCVSFKFVAKHCLDCTG